MKKIILILLLSGIHGFSINAQTERMISVSYFAPFAIQPGVKISTEFPLKQWEMAPDSEQPKIRTLSIRPQVAYFAQPDLHQNFLLGTELAYTLKKAGKCSYLAPSVGLNYLLSRENIEGSVNLGSGEISQEKETLHYFLPTLNLEFGRLPKKQIGYFFKAFWGKKITSQEADSGLIGIELGLNILLKPSSI